jgi:predicted transcriptional regulator
MGFEQNIGHIQKLSDDANTKAVILAKAKEIIVVLGQKEKYALKEDDVKFFQALLEKNILYTQTADVDELEGIASQAVNKALQVLGEKPGFANEFMDALKDKMKIHSKHA